MPKELSKRQVNTIVNNLSSTYEESLIDICISLVIKDRYTADYLRDMLDITLNDTELLTDLGVEE
jgi:hypothetical protein